MMSLSNNEVRLKSPLNLSPSPYSSPAEGRGDWIPGSAGMTSGEHKRADLPTFPPNPLSVYGESELKGVR